MDKSGVILKSMMLHCYLTQDKVNTPGIHVDLKTDP